MKKATEHTVPPKIVFNFRGVGQCSVAFYAINLEWSLSLYSRILHGFVVYKF